MSKMTKFSLSISVSGQVDLLIYCYLDAIKELLKCENET